VRFYFAHYNFLPDSRIIARNSRNGRWYRQWSLAAREIAVLNPWASTVRTNMRSSEDVVLRFLSQLKNKSVFISGTAGRVTGMMLLGVVSDPTLQSFTVRDAGTATNFSVTLNLADGEFEMTTPSTGFKEAWVLRWGDDLLTIEEKLPT
jgi:hypothetical protein